MIIKCKATERAFYGNAFCPIGSIIEFDCEKYSHYEKIPSYLKPLDSEKDKVKKFEAMEKPKRLNKNPNAVQPQTIIHNTPETNESKKITLEIEKEKSKQLELEAKIVQEKLTLAELEAKNEEKEYKKQPVAK